MERLQERFDCIAVDTPGYGLSDPLPESWNDTDLTPYLRALAALMDQLHIAKSFLYGSATGAQIALEFAKAQPERCAGLLLENVALFTEAERETIVAEYFPDITATADGAHLARIWNIASRSGRYFPWFDDSADADRRGIDPPAAITEAMVRDYLLSGAGYERAYRAAFANEGSEALQGIEIPTRIVQWADSILGEYAARLDSAQLPAAVELRHAPAGMSARMDTVADTADELRALI